MKILLTGALGNLGLMTTQALLEQGYSVRCLDIPNKKNQAVAKTLATTVEVVFGDIRDEMLLTDALRDIDAVIHLAAVLPPVTENQPALADTINIDGTKNLLEAARNNGRSPLIIYASSVTVFGLQQDKTPPRSVSDPVTATDNYTRHKLACEELLRESGLPWIVLRIGVSVDSRTTATDLQTLKQLFSVDPNNRLEYVHPKDVAIALCNAVACSEAKGKILLIGGGETCQITQRQFLSGLFSAVGLNLPLSIHGKEGFYTDWMDTTQSQQLLRFQHVSYSDYLLEMNTKMRWLRKLLWPLRPLIVMLLKSLLSGRQSA